MCIYMFYVLSGPAEGRQPGQPAGRPRGQGQAALLASTYEFHHYYVLLLLVLS